MACCCDTSIVLDHTCQVRKNIEELVYEERWYGVEGTGSMLASFSSALYTSNL